MFFVVEAEERPPNWVRVSLSNDWVVWLNQNLPNTLDQGVRARLASNLKHILSGLELKAALIDGHASREPGDPSALYEPYFQNLIFEFCVGAFSVLEGLGTAHHLEAVGEDGADGRRVHRNDWRPALCAVYDPNDTSELSENVVRTASVRDKLHQDQIGLREQIDWHDFSLDHAFRPAARAIATLLLRHQQHVPEASNLVFA